MYFNLSTYLNSVSTKSRRLLLLFVVATLTGCCLIDYSEDVMEVGDRLKDKIIKFYTQFNRYPSTIESDELILSLGCTVVASNSPFRVHKCDEKRYVIDTILPKSSEQSIVFTVQRSKTICLYDFKVTKNGKEELKEVRCLQAPCLELVQ